MSFDFKRPYEISLWEDKLTIVDNNGQEYEGFVPAGKQILTSYYKEKKIAVIGSDNVNAPSYIVEPQLKRKIDGSNQLTFSIYSNYWDQDSESFIKNPFLPYLVNERKVKLKFYQKGKLQWLDFIIKNISEDSETKKYTYTAEDYFVNELSKTGLNLVFDAQLNNNYGSVQDLGARVLDGTDWKIGKNTETIQQKQEEALFEIILGQALEAYHTATNKKITILPNEKIYAFYSCISNKTEDFFQFLYKKDGQYQTDQDRVVIDDCEYYCIFNNDSKKDWPYFAKQMEYTPQYRGKRYVREQKLIYDPLIDRQVLIYTDPSGHEVRGYTKAEHISANIVENCIVNSTKYSSSSGWKHSNSSQSLSLEFVPSFKRVTKADSRLQVLNYIQLEDSYLFNSGIKDNVNALPEFIKDELFTFRIKWGVLSEDELSVSTIDVPISLTVGEYILDNSGNIIPSNGTKIFQGIATLQQNSIKDPEGYFYCDLPVLTTVSKSEIKEKKIGAFIQFPDGFIKPILIQDVQLFKVEYDEDGNKLYPNAKICIKDDNGKLSLTDQILVRKKDTKIFYYYDKDAKQEDELIYLPEEEWEYLLPQYNQNFEKVRAITIKDTNRFNILQTIAETFECWCKIQVLHKENGEILLGKDVTDSRIYDGGKGQKDSNIIDAGGPVNISEKIVIDAGDLDIENWYKQQKFITFHSQIGQKNNADFVYGINLKSIKRKLQSNDIISKLIVKQNTNEQANNGSCSISRAANNPTGENFLLNMDYYIKQGLLNHDMFYKDLYSLNQEEGWIGYYTRLKDFNNSIILNDAELVQLQQTWTSVSGEVQTLSAQKDASFENLKSAKERFYQLTKFEYEEIDPENILLDDSEVIAIMEVIITESIRFEESNSQLLIQQNAITEIEKQMDELQKSNDFLNSQKERLIQSFEQKYSRYIQEAPWSSNDYIDENLYYLDSESTLYKSSRPKVEYDIGVIELSQQPEYENYSYELGDITNMQDTEFFGWIYKNGIKTPYKEPIVITEQNIYFDQPEKDTIRVQNYRTQFEDLFQRLTASTQKVEFYSGSYDRAAAAVNTNGTLNSDILSKSLSSNSSMIKNTDNQSVIWDKKGITATNLKVPSEIIKITSGGIFLTQDGGITWTTGITGNGINANLITAGQLNVGQVVISNGDKESFRWDSTGLNAYRTRNNGGYNIDSFVRFDEFGIYGIEDQPGFVPKTLEEVRDNASFSLSWLGFHLKNKDKGGSISISNVDDFCVRDSNDNIAIKIGRIGALQDNKSQYGIIINDALGGIAFKATPEEGLIVGGWHVTKNTIETRRMADDGEEVPEVTLFSEDINDQNSQRIVCKQKRSDWRITAGSKFGVTKDGTVYTEELEADSATISNWSIENNKIVSSQFAGTIEGEYEQIELSNDGIMLKSFTEENLEKPYQTFYKTWKQILS